MRGLYRRRQSEAIWHFCTNCSQWPEKGVVEVTFVSSIAKPLCPECLEKQTRGECE
jgi:hypothetical protein